jgi:uncharacterized protein YdeI (YjbR/CyaY-like superfamily)
VTARRPARKTRSARVKVTSFAGRRSEIPRPRFFATPAAWRAWLAKHHAGRTELWVGFHRVATGRRSITWPQSVDEALCFGWIDGLRRGLDASSYAIRFTPRKPTSIWSRVNLRRFDELARAGLVRAAGRAAFARKRTARSGVYSFEQERAGLDAAGERRLRADRRAWAWWSARPPGYRRNVGHWVTSAKRPETRARRLAMLVASCRRGEVIPPLAWTKRKRPTGR